MLGNVNKITGSTTQTQDIVSPQVYFSLQKFRHFKLFVYKKVSYF